MEHKQYLKTAAFNCTQHVLHLDAMLQTVADLMTRFKTAHQTVEANKLPKFEKKFNELDKSKNGFLDGVCYILQVE